MLKKVKFIISIFCLFIIIFVLTLSKTISAAITQGLLICLNILIPSMFLFLIISEFFYKTNALNKILKPFSVLCEKLFRIDRKIGPILFFSLICGYPAGANLIENLVKENKISKKTANRMLYFCVNAGPSFLIGGVSIPLSNDITFGIILFISQVISFFIIGTFSSIGEKLEKITSYQKKHFSPYEALVSSVKNSIKNMAIICGFCLFFSAVVNFVFTLNFFDINSHFYLKPLFAGFLEVTNGIVNCTQINNINTFLIITLITSFGGICIYFQIVAIVSKSKIPLKNFFLWRIFYCAVNLTIATLFFTRFSVPISTFAQKLPKNKITLHSPIISISLIILSIALLICEKKIIVKKFKRRYNK